MALTKIDDRGLKTPIDLLDNEKIRFGTGNDLEIYHNATDSVIKSDTNKLRILSDEIHINNNADGENLAKFNANGNVELYYDDSKKFETTSTGTNVTGVHVDDGATHDGDVSLNGASYNAWWDKSDNAFKFDDYAKIKVGTGGDLEIFHDTNDSYIRDSGTGDLYIDSNKLKVNNAASNETMAIFNADGAVELYYNNSKKLETRDAGINTVGNHYVTDNNFFGCGDGADLQIFHDTSHNYIKGASHEIRIQSEDIRFRNAANNKTMLYAHGDGACELYYDNAKHFYTTQNGSVCKRDSGGNTEFDVIGSEGNDAELRLIADDGDDNPDFWRLIGGSYTFYIQSYADGGWETNIKCNGGSGVELHHNDTLTARTTTEGWEIPSGKHLSIPNGTWTGDETGKIQTHSDHIYFQCSHDTNGGWIFRLPGGQNAASINYGGTYSTSDERLKKDITTIPNAVDTIKKLTGRSFTWKLGDKKSFGLIAQEVEPIIPDVVITSGPDPANKYPDDPMRSVNYAALTGHLIEAIKELSTKIETLETKVAALEAA